MRTTLLTTTLTALCLSACASVEAENTKMADSTDKMIKGAPGETCSGFGPQTPRDIDSKIGTNSVAFPYALSTEKMNLCNIHFHEGAEHKAEAFSVSLPRKANGESGGYQCNSTSRLSAAELAPYSGNMCKGVTVGDTIEVHWVHSSCDVSPGAGLGSCLSDACANPSLRVETQVFTVVNDRNALNFQELTKISKSASGKYQALNIPSNTGSPVEFLGSTTGPKYTEQSCSPLQVSWSVRPTCAKVDVQSLSQWCEANEFSEDHAHGVRDLVTSPELLSPIN